MLRIESVAEASAAAQVDILVGDRLRTYDGKALFSPGALLALEENTFETAGVQRACK